VIRARPIASLMKGSIVTAPPSSHAPAPLDLSSSSTNTMLMSSFRDMVDGDIDVTMKNEPSSPDISIASSVARRSDRSDRSDHTAIDGPPHSSNNSNNLSEPDDDSVKSENGLLSPSNGTTSGNHLTRAESKKNGYRPSGRVSSSVASSASSLTSSSSVLASSTFSSSSESSTIGTVVTSASTVTKGEATTVAQSMPPKAPRSNSLNGISSNNNNRENGNGSGSNGSSSHVQHRRRDNFTAEQKRVLTDWCKAVRLPLNVCVYCISCHDLGVIIE
jgi:hypothetical protein